MNIRFLLVVMVSGVLRGAVPVNAVEARNRLLQAYDEEVTIRRTLARASVSGGLSSRRRKIKTAVPPSFLAASAKRSLYGFAVGCAEGAGEDAGEA
jgi:hypothetical protein